MTKTDLNFLINNYKDKDEREETYYLTIKAKDKEGSEVELLSHLDNKTATGAKLVRKLASRVRDTHTTLIIKEFKAFSPGSSAAKVAIQTYTVPLEKNTNQPMKMNNEITEMFGGLGGFGAFREEQGKNVARLETLVEKVEDLKEEKAQLLIKIGNFEKGEKDFEREIKNLESKIRDLRWERDDIERNLKNDHDSELRKYKGQNAVIQAGVQGLGGLLVKKLNISDSDLQGLLGMDTPTAPTQPNNTNESAFNDIEVEPENLSPEQQYIKQKADGVHNWMLTADRAIVDKVYTIFQSITSSEQNLNDFYELANQEVSV